MKKLYICRFESSDEIIIPIKMDVDKNALKEFDTIGTKLKNFDFSPKMQNFQTFYDKFLTLPGHFQKSFENIKFSGLEELGKAAEALDRIKFSIGSGLAQSGVSSIGLTGSFSPIQDMSTTGVVSVGSAFTNLSAIAPDITEIFAETTDEVTTLTEAFNTFNDVVGGETVDALESILSPMEMSSAIMESGASVWTNHAKSIKEVGKAANEARKELDNLNKSASNINWRQIGNRIKNTFASVTNYLKKSVTASNDYVEAINLYTMAVGGYAEAGKKWANEISDKLYLEIIELSTSNLLRIP